MPAVQFYDEDGHSTAPVSRTKPMPAQVQVGAVPVDEGHPLPAQVQVGAVPVSEENPLPVGLAPTEWGVTGTDDGGGETITKAGESGRCHYVAGVDVCQAGAGVAAVLVQLKDGSTLVWHGLLSSRPAASTNAGELLCNFSPPFKMSSGAAASLVVAPCGEGVTVTLAMRGYTR